MHAEALMFAARMRAAMPGSRHILEIGSRHINGTIRPLFADAESYVGIDVDPGPGVDVVADGATFTPSEAPSVVVCMEVFEHTPAGPEIVANAARVLTDGGWFLVTCATVPRAPHSAIDGGPLHPGEYYGNVHPTDLRDWVRGAGLTVVQREVDLSRGDLYLLARKEVQT